MRTVQQYRLIAVVGLGIAALLIVWCLLSWMLQLQPLGTALLAALGPLVAILASLYLIWRARVIERRIMDRLDP